MLFLEAAEHGLSDAMCKVGDCYYLGTGVEQNYIKAVEWYQKAIKEGDAFAMYRLGSCYKNGHGVAIDRKKAAYLFYKADLKGCSEAEKELDSLAPSELLLLTATGPALNIAAPVVGCILWFCSVPIWVNIIFLAVSGIIAYLIYLLEFEPNTFRYDFGAAIFGPVLNALFFIIITAIAIAVLEGILWLGARFFR